MIVKSNASSVQQLSKTVRNVMLKENFALNALNRYIYKLTNKNASPVVPKIFVNYIININYYKL